MANEIIEAIKQLPPKQQATALAINHHLQKWQESESNVQKQILKLKTEYLRNVLPIQKEFNAIINGLRTPNEEELKEANNLNIEIKQTQTSSPLSNFWGQVLINNPLTGKLLSEGDKEIFQHLKTVEAELGENGKDFKLKFEFQDNEHFDACTLIKEYIFTEDDEEHPSKLKGSQIKWKEGKNITKKIIKKKQKNKNGGQLREISKEVKAPSFFHFFEDIDAIQDEDEQDERKQFDYELGSTFVNSIIPHALGNYLGLKIEDDEDYEELLNEEDEEEQSLDDE